MLGRLKIRKKRKIFGTSEQRPGEAWGCIFEGLRALGPISEKWAKKTIHRICRVRRLAESESTFKRKVVNRLGETQAGPSSHSTIIIL